MHKGYAIYSLTHVVISSLLNVIFHEDGPLFMLSPSPSWVLTSPTAIFHVHHLPLPLRNHCREFHPKPLTNVSSPTTNLPFVALVPPSSSTTSPNVPFGDNHLPIPLERLLISYTHCPISTYASYDRLHPTFGVFELFVTFEIATQDAC